MSSVGENQIAPDVLIVGAGPAGLSAAIELKKRGVAQVVVIEREREAGGVPRHCFHPGFGLQDLRRNLTGPNYAQRLVSKAQDLGIEIATSSTVNAIAPDKTTRVTSPHGILDLHPRFVLLTTGVRERPRSARLVPGTRPAGVFTTGQLQQWVGLKKFPVGSRALVVGAEHISFSAVQTLRHAGVSCVAMVTDHPRHQSLWGASLLTRAVSQTPLLVGTELIEILGTHRVEGALLRNVASGSVEKIDVDTIVFTGDWVPDAELAYRSAIEISPLTRGPMVESDGRTSVDQIFAAGNLVQPAETAGIAARRGAEAAMHIARQIYQPIVAQRIVVPLECDESLLWVTPQRLVLNEELERLYFRTRLFSSKKFLAVRQGNRVLGRYRLRHTSPNRGLSVPGAWSKDVERESGPVRIALCD